MKAIAYMAGLLAIACMTGCASLADVPQTPTVSVTSDSYCRIARPIEWSTRDTRPTLAAIRRHNARFHRACRGATS